MPLQLARPEQSLDPSLDLASVALPEPTITLTNTNSYNNLPIRTPTIFPDAAPEIQTDWNNLVALINEHYHEIDIEAIRIAMSVGLAQKSRPDVPIWLFVLGASGTGKSLIPEILSPLPDMHRINSITANTLLSGLPKSKGGESLLLSIGKEGDHSGILVFPDFSTVISRKSDVVAVIAGDLREVYDGHLIKHTGSSKVIKWEGKITIVAMCTPDLERLWGPMRGLGERFVQVRWGRSDGIQQATKAYQQIGNESRIKKEIAQAAAKFYAHSIAMFPTALNPIDNGVAHIAEITALLRTGAARDDRTKKLEDISEPEGNTRFFKAIVQVARSHAALFKREMLVEDYKLAARVAIDSIPMNRLLVVRSIPDSFPDEGCSQIELLEKINKPKSTVLRTIEELELLGVVKVDRSGAENWVELSSKFIEMKRRAKLLWH